MRTSPWYLRDRLAWGCCRRRLETACGSLDEKFSGTCTVVTGLRAPQKVHREDATMRRKRSGVIGIDADSGPDQYGAV